MRPALLALLLVGCGGPICEDESLEASFMDACHADDDASEAYCGCVWGVLASSQTCGDLGHNTAKRFFGDCTARTANPDCGCPPDPTTPGVFLCEDLGNLTVAQARAISRYCDDGGEDWQ